MPVRSSQGGTTGPRQGHGGSAWWIIPVVLLAAAMVAAAVVAIRRRRDLSAAGASPDQRIVREWNRAQLALRRRGLGRRVAETPLEYVARVERYEGRAAARVGAEALGRLASLVQLACYTPQPCTGNDAEAARALAVEIRVANRRRWSRPVTT